MKRICLFIVTSSLMAVCTAVGDDTCPIGVDADVQFRSAYHSRMRVSEDRPVVAVDLRVHTEVGPFGRIGAMNWNRSSLCNRTSYMRRRAFNEVDFAAFWHYDVKIAEGYTLSNELMHWWITIPQNIDPYRGKKDNSTYEFWYIGSFKNPYIVPSLLVRRGWWTKSWVYFQYGLSKPLTIYDFGDAKSPRPLVLTPGFFVETGSNGLFESRFGKKESGNYHTGIGTCIAQLALKWTATENLSLHATLQQYDIVSSDARDGAGGIYRRDLTMFRLGMHLSF
jgi:hypothetical protein